jgi:hypothetical protein
MKKNITILIGVAVLIVVLYGAQRLMNNSEDVGASDVVNEIAMQSVTGQVLRVFEGEHILDYSMDIPETSTTSVSMEGALLRVTEEANPLITVYFSYEGGRGYTPLDYINNKIAPQVAVIDPLGTTTIGNLDWQVAESEGSEWRIAQVMNGEWLIVTENRKSVHDMADSILNSVVLK